MHQAHRHTRFCGTHEAGSTGGGGGAGGRRSVSRSAGFTVTTLSAPDTCVSDGSWFLSCMVCRMLIADAAGNGAEASELDKKADEAKNALSTVTNLGQAIFNKVKYTIRQMLRAQTLSSSFIQSYSRWPGHASILNN